MRLLIDGYNLMFESTSVDQRLDGKNALRAARGRLMDLLLEWIEEESRSQTMIVFDAKKAPPGLPDRYEHHGIRIVFARDWDSADELIQTEIRRHPTPKLLTVVSSDHMIHKKANARGATVLDSQVWLDRQIAARARRFRDSSAASDAQEESMADEKGDGPSKQKALDVEEKAHWLKEFGY